MSVPGAPGYGRLFTELDLRQLTFAMLSHEDSSVTTLHATRAAAAAVTSCEAHLQFEADEPLLIVRGLMPILRQVDPVRIQEMQAWHELHLDRERF